MGALLAMRSDAKDGLVMPRYEVAAEEACASDDEAIIGLGPTATMGSGATVTHYITLHSPSFCWPILLLVMRSR